MTLAIRTATPDDADGVCRVYNPFVADTIVTFEEAPVPVAEMATRIADLVRAHPWLVAVDAGEVVGYAYAGPWRSRVGYRFAVESTVYVARDRVGRGVGSALYDTLLADCVRRGFHCAMGGIALPNAGSVALHERKGFAKVAHFREAGYKFGRRIDVGYWQRML